MTDIAALRRSLCETIEIDDSDPNRVRMYLPHTFGDGDHYAFAVESIPDGRFRITDEGEALSRADMLLDQRRRRSFDERLNRVCEFYGISRVGGALSVETSMDTLGESVFELTQILITLMDSARQLLDRSPQERERRMLQRIARKRFEQSGLWNDPMFHTRPLRLMVDWTKTGRRLPLSFDYAYGMKTFPDAVLSRAMLGNPSSVSSLLLKFEKLKSRRDKVRCIALVGTKHTNSDAENARASAEDPEGRVSIDDAAAVIKDVAELIDLDSESSVDQLRTLKAAG